MEPCYQSLMGFFIVIVELFILGVITLFAMRRIRKELIGLNRKIDLFAQPSEQRPEKGPERKSEELSEKDPEKKKYRYRWK